MIKQAKPHGSNRVDATFRGHNITFYSWANNAIEVYIAAAERFRELGHEEATCNNVSVLVY